MKYLSLIMLFFLGNALQAQQFNWGEPTKHNELEFSGASYTKRYLLKESESGLLRLRVEKKDLMQNETVTLEKYDAKFVLDKSKIVFNGIMTSKQLEEVIVANDRFFIFFADPDLKAKTNILKVQEYDFEGNEVGEPVTLDVIQGIKTLSIGEFYVAASQNRQHFATIAIPMFDKEANETIQVKTFGASFQPTFEAAITIEVERKRFVFNTPYIMNDGTFFMHKQHKIKKVGEVREMYVLDKGSKKLNPTPLKLPNEADLAYLENVMLENSKGNFVYAGLQKPTAGFSAPKGVFFIEFDKNGKIVQQKIHDFPNAPKLGFTGLILKDVQLLPNDDLLFVAHPFKENNTVVGTDANNRTYTYSAEDIFVARVQQSGELAWSQIIKRPFLNTTNDKGRLLDVVWLYDKEGDNVVVLYNDLYFRFVNGQLPSTYKIPVLAYIAKDGSYSNKPLLDVKLGKYNDSYTFCTDEFYQRGNYLIVKCSNNIDYKLGRFSF